MTETSRLETCSCCDRCRKHCVCCGACDAGGFVHAGESCVRCDVEPDVFALLASIRAKLEELPDSCSQACDAFALVEELEDAIEAGS